MNIQGRSKGIQAALASALFLGLAPIFGKQAMFLGFTPLAVVALRTGIAVLLLVGLMAIFQRPFFYIYPVGLVGCLLAGFFNGVGSILYYSGLNRLDASIGQLIYSFYPLFLALWLLLDRQPIHRVTLFRLTVALPGVYLLISSGQRPVDLVGALMMAGSAIFYALHLLINQRILYEVPAPTVTLYTSAVDEVLPFWWHFCCSTAVCPKSTCKLPARAWTGRHHFLFENCAVPGCQTPGQHANCPDGPG